jgi:hypothetical protein
MQAGDRGGIGPFVKRSARGGQPVQRG